VLLDATSIGPDIERRFPTIVAACRQAGIDPLREPIPVAPAAHFACGGVQATLAGVTSVSGLFAVGEVAATGVHGANRLASNGVTEGLVAGRLVGAALAGALPESGEPEVSDRERDGTAKGWIDPVGRLERAAGMSRWVGPLRDEAGMAAMAALLDAAPTVSGSAALDLLEATNLHAVSWLIVRGAMTRHESRGCHRRLDAPDASPAWLGRIEQRLRDSWDAEFVPDEVAA
jgi:L-aspartate oxidase